MSAIVFVLAGMLACAMVLVVGWRYYYRRASPVSVTYIIASRWWALR